MARKNGLNRKEQLLCAKALTDGIKPDLVAKKFKTSVAVVKRFTQANLDAADKKAKDRLTAQKKVAEEQRATAGVIKQVIAKDFA